MTYQSCGVLHNNDNRTLAHITFNHDDRCGSIQDARSLCIDFFQWYNTMHHHGSLGLLTPFEVHYGLAAKRTEHRALVLRKAFEANPERFVRGAPKPPAVPKEVWINKPRTRSDEPDALDIDF